MSSSALPRFWTRVLPAHLSSADARNVTGGCRRTPPPKCERDVSIRDRPRPARLGHRRVHTRDRRTRDCSGRGHDRRAVVRRRNRHLHGRPGARHSRERHGAPVASHRRRVLRARGPHHDRGDPGGWLCRARGHRHRDCNEDLHAPPVNVPQAITVVTRAMIADQSMQSLADVVRYVPGVGMAQGEGNRDAAVFRGNSSTGDFFVDGIRDDVQYFRDLYNVERVEALKGPNAMIFGRGGAGGSSTGRHARPTGPPARSDVQVGSFDNRRAMFDVGRSGGEPRCRARDGDVRELRQLPRRRRPRTLRREPDGRVCGGAWHHRCGPATSASTTSARPTAAFPRGTAARSKQTRRTFFGDPDESVARATVDALTAGLEHRFTQRVSLRNRTRFAAYDKFYQNVYRRRRRARRDGLSVPIAAYNNLTDRQNLFSQTDLNVFLTTGTLQAHPRCGRRARAAIHGQFPRDRLLRNGCHDRRSRRSTVRTDVGAGHLPAECLRCRQPWRCDRCRAVCAGPGRAVAARAGRRRVALRRLPGGLP